MQIIRVLTTDHHWLAVVAHLRRVEMGRWVLDDHDSALPDVHFIAAINDKQVIGHIALKRQPIIIPSTEWAGGKETTLTLQDGKVLFEAFVQTFAVEEVYRRHGYGRELQLAALELTSDLSCYQMRSWSSLDKNANYALKLSLGFAFHPARSEASDGLQISGGYFVKTAPTQSR